LRVIASRSAIAFSRTSRSFSAARAMRDAVLLELRQLGHRLVRTVDEEEGVVAEAA
jgi:hypothetical protein